MAAAGSPTLGLPAPLPLPALCPVKMCLFSWQNLRARSNKDAKDQMTKYSLESEFSCPGLFVPLRGRPLRADGAFAGEAKVVPAGRPLDSPQWCRDEDRAAGPGRAGKEEGRTACHQQSQTGKMVGVSRYPQTRRCLALKMSCWPQEP